MELDGFGDVMDIMVEQVLEIVFVLLDTKGLVALYALIIIFIPMILVNYAPEKIYLVLNLFW